MLTPVQQKIMIAKLPNEMLPQRKRMSYEAYLAFVNETQIMDWVDGEVLIYRPPTFGI